MSLIPERFRRRPPEATSTMEGKYGIDQERIMDSVNVMFELPWTLESRFYTFSDRMAQLIGGFQSRKGHLKESLVLLEPNYLGVEEGFRFFTRKVDKPQEYTLQARLEVCRVMPEEFMPVFQHIKVSAGMSTVPRHGRMKGEMVDRPEAPTVEVSEKILFDSDEAKSNIVLMEPGPLGDDWITAKPEPIDLNTLKETWCKYVWDIYKSSRKSREIVDL